MTYIMRGVCQAYSRTRIHRKEETTVLDLIVKVHPIDSGLNDNIHTIIHQPDIWARETEISNVLLFMKSDDSIHLREVDT